MKILWVKPGKLLPLDTGGKLRSYNILHKLAACHELTYLSYYGGQRDEAYEREILTHLPGTVSIFIAARDTTPIAKHSPECFLRTKRAVRSLIRTDF